MAPFCNKIKNSEVFLEIESFLFFLFFLARDEGHLTLVTSALMFFKGGGGYTLVTLE